MITIEADTFYQAGSQLAVIDQPVHALTIKLHSPFDAPLLFPAMSSKQAKGLEIQTNAMVYPISINPNFQQLQSFTLYCHFTLNSWKSFDSLVEMLNGKNDNIQIQFITSVGITQDSFIYQLKNCTGKVEQWA